MGNVYEKKVTVAWSAAKEARFLETTAKFGK